MATSTPAGRVPVNIEQIHRHRRETPVLHRLLDVGHRRARAARRARRPEARASPHPLRDVRARACCTTGATRSAPASSATCSRSTTRTATRRLRHARPHGAGLLHALPADRRPGQLRLRRRRSARRLRYTECRMAQHRRGAAGGHRQGDGRLRAQLRRLHDRAARPAGALPNLLVNGSTGIAVGMATNIPPHNLREISRRADRADREPGARRSTS